MSSSEKDVQQLIRLKRHEAPPEGYFEDFLEEFQERQRGELMQQSSLGLFKERLGTWFRELGSLKWVAGAGVAYAGVLVAVFMWPGGGNNIENPNISPASFRPEFGQPIPAVDFRNLEKLQSDSTTHREF